MRSAGYQQLLNQYPIISDQIDHQGLDVVLRELENVLERGIEGDIVEFGCYVGTTSLFIRRLLDHKNQSSERKFYAYDSFAGLPDKTTEDISSAGIYFTSGELAISKKKFIENFHHANISPPITIKSWFADLSNDDLPYEIAFAFLDGDFYQSILNSLKLVWPKLSKGGVLLIDDYQKDSLPGVEKAINKFFQNEQINFRHEHNIAIINKS